MNRTPHYSPRARRLTVGLGILAVAMAACGSSSSGSSSSESQSSAASNASHPLVPPGSAAPAPDAGASPTGDLGFRPDKNGLPFQNYGPDYPSLTASDVRTIFGDAACASTQGGTCLPTQEAAAWMDGMNKAMAGGHCYGFSVLALQMFKGDLKPSDLGADSVPQLNITNNPALSSRLAIDWVAQTFPAVQNAGTFGTPNDILTKLLEYFQSGASSKETYTLAIFKSDGTGGHAITPYAAVDHGNGSVGVLVYDNNFPATVREATFDRNANSYTYNGSPNPQTAPDVYSGKIYLLPTTPGQGPQPCFFCGKAGATSLAPTGATLASAHTGAAVTADTSASYYQVILDGSPDSHAHLVFTDDAGHRTGIVGGSVLGEVPGVTAIDPALGYQYNEQDEPIYDVKLGTKIEITLDGTGLTAPDNETIDIIGPGVDAQLRNINVAPGQQDTLTLSPDGTALSYKTARSESPTLELGRAEASADWAADLVVHGGQGGSTLLATLTDAALVIGGAGDTAAGYDLQLSREDSGGAQTFKHSGISLNTGDVATLDYTKFTKHGDSIPATIQANGQSQQQTLDDQG